jgi:hypothetical protein
MPNAEPASAIPKKKRQAIKPFQLETEAWSVATSPLNVAK